MYIVYLETYDLKIFASLSVFKINFFLRLKMMKDSEKALALPLSQFLIFHNF